MKAATEASFQATVIAMAQSLGWKCAAIRRVRVKRKDGSVYYETPMQADGAGWLDVFMIHPVNRWKLAAELKILDRPTTPEQKLWLQWHELSGTPAYTWRDCREDWLEIETVLREGPK